VKIMPCGVDPVSFDKDLMSNISKRKMHRVADSSKTTIYSIATTGKMNNDEKAIEAYQKTQEYKQPNVPIINMH